MISFFSYAQYFQGGFSLGTNDTIIFKIKPVGGNITTSISYMEFAFRYVTAQAPTLTTSAPVNNTALFGSALNVVAFPPNYVEAPYTYIKYVHNTGTVASATYVQNTEYTVFKVKLSQSPTQQTGIQMASNLPSGNYVFGVIDGAGNFFDPGSNAQLYGSGLALSNDTYSVPLIPGTVGVKFITFNASSNGKVSSLKWVVTGESNSTSHYVIERSTNGNNFSSIGQMTSLKNANNIVNYSFEDKDFANQNIAYYRIKQVDNDGLYTFSNVEVLKNSNYHSIAISPNPASNTTNIIYALGQAKDVVISLMDVQGKRLMTFNTIGHSGMNKFPIQVTNLAKGIYSVLVETNSSKQTIKLIKN